MVKLVKCDFCNGLGYVKTDGVVTDNDGNIRTIVTTCMRCYGRGHTIVNNNNEKRPTVHEYMKQLIGEL